MAADRAVEATLSLGGNVGDPVDAFAYALDRLSKTAGVAVCRCSSIYRTAPWGKTDQPDFLNMAVVVDVRLSAHELLALCLDIERERGRERLERWGPRTLDIDMLTFGNEVISSDDLTIPHPRMSERAFVLVPLAEIASDVQISGKSVKQLCVVVDRRGVVRDDKATRRLELLQKREKLLRP